MNKNSYSILGSRGEHIGRYISSNPAGAAKKAARQHGFGDITVVNTTLGSHMRGKQNSYRVKKVKLPSPKHIVRDGVSITVKHKTVAHKI